MTFIELLRRLERHLGNHQIPLNPAAHGIKDIFESTPLHPEFTTKLVRAIYSGNRCQSLDDPVTHADTIAALTPLRLELLRAKSTDVDTHRMLNELCAALAATFAAPLAAIASVPRAPQRRSADIVDFALFRRGRRLKSSI
jgi:hypothetical protein